MLTQLFDYFIRKSYSPGTFGAQVFRKLLPVWCISSHEPWLAEPIRETQGCHRNMVYKIRNVAFDIPSCLEAYLLHCTTNPLLPELMTC